MNYTVGQLAKLTGVTVRTLHHYEAQGLLVPKARTTAGYRQYTDSDVLTLHRILACKQLGISLSEIAAHLGQETPGLQDLLTRQAAKTRADIVRLQSLLSKLERLQLTAASGNSPSLSTDLLDLMSTMQSIHQHYTSEEQKELQDIRSSLAPEDLQEMRRKLASLLEDFTAAHIKNTAPTDPEVKALARQWMALGKLAPASPELTQKTRTLIDGNSQVQRATGITAGLKAYIDQAVAIVRNAK